MKTKLCCGLVLALVLGLSLTAFAVDNTDNNLQNIQKMKDYFSGLTVYDLKEKFVMADNLIGSIIYYKKGDKQDFQYVQILNEDAVKKISPDAGENAVFQGVFDKSNVSELNLLSYFSGTLTERNYLQVLMARDYELKVPNSFTDKKVYSKLFKICSKLFPAGYVVEYVDSVDQFSFTTWLYTESNSGASVSNGVSLLIGGKVYAQTNKFDTRKIIAAHAVILDHDILSAAGGVATVKSVYPTALTGNVNPTALTKENYSAFAKQFDKLVIDQSKQKPKASNITIITKRNKLIEEKNIY